MKIMAFGDSLSAGYGLIGAESFPAQLEATLKAKGYNAKVLNAGVSGDTTSGGLDRITWALVDNPDLVILELGANDALRGLDPALVEENLDSMLKILIKNDKKILLAGMYAPPNYGEAYQKEFNAIYPRLAKRHDVILYPFFLEGVAGNPDLNLDDGIHPTGEGVAVIVGNILPYVEKVMKN